MLEIALRVVALYAAFGAVFALALVVAGVERVDPQAENSPWAFRILIIPGVSFLWPLLLWRWARGCTEPPRERNSHRL